MSGPLHTPPSKSASAQEMSSYFFSKRSLRQLSLFAGGAVFFGFATLITRRSIVRRYKATIPKYFQQSNHPNVEFDRSLEAFEALTIATVNVLSLSMMFTGGVLWALDISSLADMRRKLRGGLSMDDERQEKAAEEEMEEWLATVLARKEGKRKQDGAEAKDERNQQ